MNYYGSDQRVILRDTEDFFVDRERLRITIFFTDTIQNPPADLPVSLLIGRRSLQSSTAATSLSARAVGRHGSDVLDSTDLHAGASQGAQRGLGTGTRGARADTASGAETNMQGIDTCMWGTGRRRSEFRGWGERGGCEVVD